MARLPGELGEPQLFTRNRVILPLCIVSEIVYFRDELMAGSRSPGTRAPAYGSICSAGLFLYCFSKHDGS